MPRVRLLKIRLLERRPESSCPSSLKIAQEGHNDFRPPGRINSIMEIVNSSLGSYAKKQCSLTRSCRMGIAFRPLGEVV